MRGKNLAPISCFTDLTSVALSKEAKCSTSPSFLVFLTLPSLFCHVSPSITILKLVELMRKLHNWNNARIKKPASEEAQLNGERCAPPAPVHRAWVWADQTGAVCCSCISQCACVCVGLCVYATVHLDLSYVHTASLGVKFRFFFKITFLYVAELGPVLDSTVKWSWPWCERLSFKFYTTPQVLLVQTCPPPIYDLEWRKSQIFEQTI